MTEQEKKQISATRKLLLDQGGYYNQYGELYAGISRIDYPNWEGWSIIDSFQPIPYGGYISSRWLDSLIVEHYLTIGQVIAPSGPGSY